MNKQEMLLDACKNGNVDNVHKLLKSTLFSKGVNVNIKDENGNTPLYLAAIYDQKEIMELLITMGADVNSANKDGFTPLYVASQNGHKKIADLFITKGADVNAANKDGFAPAYVASQNGHKEIVELLVSKGADINAANKDGFTPVYIASEKGHKEIVELLITKGVDVNVVSNDGYTPVYGASFDGHKEIVELLVSKGADINAANKDGFTPMYVASQNGHKEIAEMLTSKGADINAASKNGFTPVYIASQNGHKEIAEMLITKGADVNVASNSGLTPLHGASMKGQYEIVELLLSKGANVNAINKDGSRPIDLVKENDKIVSLLQKYGAISKPKAKITQESLTIVLVDSKSMGDAGPGGSSFQKAIQSLNNQNDAEATLCFEDALKKGLDKLRQGYSHMNLGEIYIRANDIDKAMDEFTKVLNFKEAIYESVHTAVQYLGIIYSELGKQDIVNVLEQLKNKTLGKINYSLSFATVERVRQLAIKNKSRLIEREATSLTPTTEVETKIWEEKDNRGTRQETYQEAVAFWLARNASHKNDPFILYTFDHEENARNALLHTGIVHLTHDSGKLICTETLTFGYYRRDDSKYEALICGEDLTRELWVKTKEGFLKQGGILNNEQEPVNNKHTEIKNPVADIQQVKFLREDKTSNMGQIAVYRVHSAPDSQSAKAFLEQNPVNQKFLYLVVETPEGNYCRDIVGIYKE